MQITKKDESLKLESFTITIYGEAGAGKTTLGNTAKNAIVFDFDEGHQRSKLSSDVFERVSYKEIATESKLRALLTGYDTIVIDTAGAMIDSIKDYLIEKKPQLATQKLQMYGEIKSEFTTFHKFIRSLGINIVFIMHSKETFEGEIRRLKPLAEGSSYDQIIAKSDMIGYLHKDSAGNTIIDFNAYDWKVGKNSAELTPYAIPHYSEMGMLLQQIIDDTKEAFNQNRISQAQAIDTIKATIREAHNLQSVDEFNAFFEALQAKGLGKGEKTQIWNALLNHAINTGLEFDTKEKAFKGIAA